MRIREKSCFASRTYVRVMKWRLIETLVAYTTPRRHSTLVLHLQEDKSRGLCAGKPGQESNNTQTSYERRPWQATSIYSACSAVCTLQQQQQLGH